LAHYLGLETASVQFKPFGSAELAKYGVGMNL